MQKNYILSIDQSTQGTKALLFDLNGNLVSREDMPHRQIISSEGWVSHDLQEIYQNVLTVVKKTVENTKIDKSCILGLGISNQRETVAVWDRMTGEPADYAVVWQCSRAKAICQQLRDNGFANSIQAVTGIPLSPYYSAAKLAWLLQHSDVVKQKAEEGRLALGTMDTWLLFKLTKGESYFTDYSNASRTQLFNLSTLKWDSAVCEAFGINPADLAEVKESNSILGETDFDGYLDKPIPIAAMMGDSHAALFGQGCHQKGMIKTTYGTGSSVMMNIGEKPIFSANGVVTSIAWGMNGKVNYVLEGNINYTGGVVSWLKNDLHLIESAKETESLIQQADPDDQTYLVPAFSGLGAPYWDNDAKAVFYGMTRKTGRAELVKAGVDSIAYQITAVLDVMRTDSQVNITQLRVDGGPTRNQYLMQLQSDLANIPVFVPQAEELSGIGAAYAAGIRLGLYDDRIFQQIKYQDFSPHLSDEKRVMKKQGWQQAVKIACAKN